MDKKNNMGEMVTKVLTYANKSELSWRANLQDMSGYEPITTAFYDLSIAECFGVKSIRDTYKKLLKAFKGDIKTTSELVISLNHKIWIWYHRENDELARLYDELWKATVQYVYDNFTSQEDLSYYFNVTD